MDIENQSNSQGGSGARPTVDYAKDFLTSLNTQAKNDDHSKPLPKWFVIVALVFAVVCIISAVVALSFTLSESEPVSLDDEFYNNIYDENAIPETLSGDFAEAVSQNELSSYRSDYGFTIYAGLTPQEFCRAIDISCSSLWNPIDNDRLEKIAAIGSNGLDYYLDSGNIVVMNAVYEFSDVVSSLVIYAREMNLYEVFDANNVLAGAIYLTRAEIFNNVVEVPSFYVLKGVK